MTMNKKTPTALDGLDFHVPPGLIAQQPASPRDSAKLFVYDRHRRSTSLTTFRKLKDFLPPQAVLVFNQTKVVPARIEATKETGGKVKLLALRWTKRKLVALADRKILVGQELEIAGHRFVIAKQSGAEFTLRSQSFIDILQVLERHGHAPIPPYIKRSPLTGAKLKKEYQTVFARTPGSVAAPTASLHFTSRLMSDLRRSGFGIEFVTLHVNLGTFAPVTSQQLKQGRLHTEIFFISPSVAHRLNFAHREGRPIIAVGTTVARTLESAVDQGRLRSGARQTDIFIRPGYQWKFVDGLITNFHVPRSSLLMLVASLVGREKLLQLYRSAIRKKFRLFSFGDGMMILP